MSRRSRLHYHLATIGYWASRMMARSPRPEGLPGDSLSFGAAVRYELPSHTTSRQNRHPDLSRRDDSCNCFSLMVTSDRSHKGISLSITAPCPAHAGSPRLGGKLPAGPYTLSFRVKSTASGSGIATWSSDPNQHTRLKQHQTSVRRHPRRRPVR